MINARLESTGRTVLRGGTLADGLADQERPADLAVEDGAIAAVGDVPSLPGDRVIDCAGRLIMPGLVDAHSHADSRVFEDEIAHALLRQGVTTVIVGQDGVSYAPGDGRYATDYFAAINGPHPHYSGGGVAALLAGYDETTPINVGYLVPAGTVRQMIMGNDSGPATDDQRADMITVVAAGLAEGGLGLSTGLDYVPGCFADADELTALCRPVAEAGKIYVTHMRGGYEENSASGVDEVIMIARASGAHPHVSHFHARSDLIIDLVDAARDDGIDLTFDSYPYSRGCTVLGMLMLPPELMADGFDVAVTQLARPEVQAAVVADWIPVMAARADMGRDWANNIRLAHVAAPEFAWSVGCSLAEAASLDGSSPADFGVRVLAASRLEVSVVMSVPVQRNDDQMAPHLAHPAHMGGSDGIFLGGAPHPRGWGTFARYLADFTAARGDLTWSQAAQRFGRSPSVRFGLADRGALVAGGRADLIIVDPDRVATTATYAHPRSLAEGIDDVFVNGRQVLAGGELTGVRSGRGLRG